MAVVLTWQSSTPGQPQFGLATLTEHYKVQNDDGTQITAAAVMTSGSVPQQGDAHPDYAFMFVTDRHCAEAGESASALDVTYMGCLTDDGMGEPNLPVGQLSQNQQIASASSQNGPAGGFELMSPVTLQFFAPSNVLTWVSNAPGALGPSGAVTAPSGDIQIFGYTFKPDAIPFGFTGDLFLFFKTNFFIELVTIVITSQEIVAGEFWTNTGTATKTLIPFAYLTGANVLLNTAGTGYTVGDSLSISSGGEGATITVTAITSSGGVGGWTVSANTFTMAHSGLSASGGTGSGATFDVFITT